MGLHKSATAVDDVSGVTLDPQEVLRARLEEVAWMRQKGVYKKITRQEAKRRGMDEDCEVEMGGHKQKG